MKEYKPAPLLMNQVNGLIFNRFLAKDKHIQIDYERTLLKCQDGGTISVDWAFPQNNGQQK